MKKLTTKRIFAGLMALTVISLFALPIVVGAVCDPTTDPLCIEDAKIPGLSENPDLKAVVVAIVGILLGFLGIIAVIIILWGGFIYMTASGDSAKTDKAKSMIISGIIGIIIILAAWAIANFVITNIGTALQE